LRFRGEAHRAEHGAILRGGSRGRLPISGIGGIGNWRDAAEFIALGATGVQVCTAIMHYGFRIVEDMIDGLSGWMDEKGYKTIADFSGKAVQSVDKWETLNLNYKRIATLITTSASAATCATSRARTARTRPSR
jgi:dihydropyrimidine dehydrogenase (NAD+) subunit PreA